MGFGIYLKGLIDKRGYSYRQLGMLSGINHTYISKIVSEKMGPPSPEILKKLSKPLEVPYEELMEMADYIDIKTTYKTEPVQMVSEEKIAKVPIYGVIQSGEPHYSAAEIEGYEYIAEKEVRYGEYFYLRITEDSMLGSRIYPGDLVYVRKQKNIENGDIAVVLVGEKATLRRVFKADGKVILQPDNPKYEPQIYTEGDIKILGKVLHVKFKP